MPLHSADGFHHPEETFERLRYLSEATAHQTPACVVPGRLTAQLEAQYCRVVSQQRLWCSWRHTFSASAYPVHAARTQHQIWSKAPWGLSVLARVTSIFTGISISPDALPRQCPDHYAFRAGRNLPDKEFRYLRTVIVTAAVYWGLSSELRIYMLTPPLNLPAPGRRQPIYFTLRFRIDLCFC